jgi:hypothetical protein
MRQKKKKIRNGFFLALAIAVDKSFSFCEWSRALYAGLCKAMMAGVSSVRVS